MSKTFNRFLVREKGDRRMKDTKSLYQLPSRSSRRSTKCPKEKSLRLTESAIWTQAPTSLAIDPRTCPKKDCCDFPRSRASTQLHEQLEN